MKKTIFCLLLSIISFSSFSQIKIYFSEDDFKNNTPKIYNDVERINAWSGGFDFKADKKYKFLFPSVWGFEFKDNFFRVIQSELKYQCKLAILRYKGKICYWENGVVAIEIMNNPDKNKVYVEKTSGDLFYLSETIDTEIHFHNFRRIIRGDYELYKPFSQCVYNAMPEKTRKGLAGANKFLGLDGSDDVSMLNYLSRYSDDLKDLEIIRSCVKEFNEAE